ncbi:MAG: arsenate reductase ArsC [Candidatus Aureabacteria bacterium]|nr:arsenate reductase ArsC [Candidatus Auribacterota bacterium]
MKRVLFVCVENSCRSQIAEGFARELGKGSVEAYIAGSRPPGKVDPRSVTFMREKGIDISGQRSKGFNDLAITEFDYAVSMGCQDICPYVPGARHIAWDIRDPNGLTDEEFRAIRDEIGEKVAALITDIGGD